MEKVGSQGGVIMGDSGRREGQADVVIRARAFVGHSEDFGFYSEWSGSHEGDSKQRRALSYTKYRLRARESSDWPEETGKKGPHINDLDYHKGEILQVYSHMLLFSSWYTLYLFHHFLSLLKEFISTKQKSQGLVTGHWPS